jgi:hypothetical protein
VNLELELDSAIVSEPARLHEQIDKLFDLAKQSIEAELRAASTAGASASNPANGEVNRSHAPARSSSNGNSHSRGSQRGSTIPPATASQVRALRAIADRQGLNLEGVVRDQYGVGDPAALTIAQASELIDDLKGTAAVGDRR